MRVTKCKGMAEFRRVYRRDMRALERRLGKALRKAAQKAAAHVRRNVPVAFSELRDSVHVVGSRIIVDAPHAAAVEWGSRPHWAPLEPLVRWVKLRGFQGLQSEGQLKRLSGTTTFEHATRVAGDLAASRRGGAVGAETSWTSIDAPVEIARAIQLKIAVAGTKPQHYMAKAVPHARAFVGVEVEAALRSFREAA